MRIRNAKSKTIIRSVLLWSLPVFHCTDTNYISYDRGGRVTRFLQTTCAFDDLLASVCSLEEYCWNLGTDPGITATCSGDISGEWNILIQLKELCYPSEVREDSFARNIGDTQAELPEFGFCSIESASFHFRGSILENAQHQEIVTHPKEAKGLVHKVTEYTPCDDSVADSFFGRGYCADACPQTKLQGSLQCGEQCIVCSDGKEVLDCSNIHPTLVEECGNESAFMEVLLAFLRAEANGIVSSEPQNTSTGGNSENLDDLVTTDTEGSGDSEQEIDEPSSAAGDVAAGEDENESITSEPTNVGSIGTTGLGTSGALLTSAVRNLVFLLTIIITAQ